ncbi:MAG: thioredoxin domain-containing protein [Patescibacteria group bacterium]|nr:thioredoxin domain-containing protein [Patescibacteria group bacterium]
MENTKKNRIISFVLIGLMVLTAIIIAFFFLQQAKDDNLLSDNSLSAEKTGTVNENLEAANQAAVEQAKSVQPRTVRGIDETDHITGSINAPVQLIIYDDFECPFCADFYNITEEIKDYFKDKIVVAFRHFPLNFHALAVSAALASECAAEQGKFWEMYDLFFQANINNKLSAVYIAKAAEELDLDLAQFNQCCETEKYKDKIQEQMLEGRNYGVSGAPGNFINGEPVPGAVPFEDFIDSQGRQRQGLKTIIETKLRN